MQYKLTRGVLSAVLECLLCRQTSRTGREHQRWHRIPLRTEPLVVESISFNETVWVWSRYRPGSDAINAGIGKEVAANSTRLAEPGLQPRE